MSADIHQHASEHLRFDGDVAVATRLAACKEFLKTETAALRSRHEAGGSGLQICHERAATIDELLRSLFNYAIKSYARLPDSVPTPVALVALGGYGRGELSPWSDVDVMFLFPTKTPVEEAKPLQEHLTNEILYVLWDCGLKVGHSTRTIDDAFAEARKDIQTKTALLEARFIAGSEKVYATFSQAYRSYYISEDPKGYIESRLDDQAARRAKFANTVFNQEPDIKNGVGGLRDYQNAVWMARVKLDITSINELAAQNYLRVDDLAAFRRAYDFLLRVRNELHFMSNRATDMMSLDQQVMLAERLAYNDAERLVRVEHFMQDYYKSAQTIYRVSKLVEDRLALSIGRNANAAAGRSFRESLLASRFQKTKRLDGFVLRGRELVAEKPEVFREDPIRLLRVFRHSQQLEAPLEFHLAELIRSSLPLLTREVVHSPDANLSFRAILSERGAVFPVVSKMHELGVLARFIPEFDGLTCLVQHEFYHRYTADVHTLNAIRELDRIYTEAEPITLKYRAALHETEDASLLYLTLLLHDIGKAEGIRGHADAGVRISLPILERLGVAPEHRELIAFVIKNHLAMARFWQKRDVDDPQTAIAFADLVGTAEHLRHLYVHTFCDARATSVDLWNSYKDTLHTTLYRSTFERLKHGQAVDASMQEKKKMTQQELITKKIPGISADEINAHFSLLPDRYFVQTDPAEIAVHIQMVNRLLQSITSADSVGSLRPIIEWNDDLNRSLTVVNVVTWDRAGLFYKLAGAFSVAGLSILGAKVISRTDHIAIDTFYVVEPGRGPVQSAVAQEKFAKTIEEALVANRDLLPEILAQAKRLASTRYLSTAANHDALQSSFPPTVEVYHELSMQRTIVEVQARDQIGLLFRLAKTISDHSFDITFARIGTERGMAIDTFYIEDVNDAPVEDERRLHALRDALKEIITPAAADTPAEAAGAAKGATATGATAPKTVAPAKAGGR
ncbi:[protein-PII] uridylyltransferase [Opitutus sp. ER46]|uniref:[protein-PII] uridylyltransferase n=1 Tax=Opitutus sp. ER46 TaxID=2161864 RepID=UPI000D319E2B|nr:[protein-PII] uridylyltransferase [Opitutus sp. ER46]PTX97704.1 [protein-PII] uridylyltransferase [Opitutus sp. ER46]